MDPVVFTGKGHLITSRAVYIWERERISKQYGEFPFHFTKVSVSFHLRKCIIKNVLLFNCQTERVKLFEAIFPYESVGENLYHVPVQYVIVKYEYKV